MDFLIELQFIDATEYYSHSPAVIDYDSKQWVNKIIDITGFSEAMSLQKTYEVDRINITIDDLDRHFRMLYNDYSNQYFLNRPVIIRKIDGTLFRTTKIESWSFPDGLFSIACSHKVDMDQPITGLITAAIWPNVCAAAVNEPIPMVFNTVASVKAWKINALTSQGDWLLGTKEISTITKIIVGGQEVLDPLLWSLGSGGGYWWLNLGHGVWMGKGDFALVSVTTPAYTPVEIITSALSGKVTVATNATFKSYLAAQGYTAAKCRFYLDRQMTCGEALKIFCESFDCWWRWTTSGEVEFVWINTSSLTVVKNYQPTEHLLISPGTYADDDVKTRVTFWYNKNYASNSYQNKEVYTGASAANWGTLDYEIWLEYLTETVQANVTATHIYAINKEPHAPYTVELKIENWETLKPGDLIRLEDPIFERLTPVLCMILRTDKDDERNVAIFDVIEINDVDTLKFVLNSRGYPILSQSGYRIKMEASS